MPGVAPSSTSLVRASSATQTQVRKGSGPAQPTLSRAYQLAVSPATVFSTLARLRVNRLEKPLFIVEQHAGPTVSYRQTSAEGFVLSIETDTTITSCHGVVRANRDGCRVEVEVYESQRPFAKLRPWLRAAVVGGGLYALWEGMRALLLGQQFEFLLIFLLLSSFAHVSLGALGSRRQPQNKFARSLLESLHNRLQPLGAAAQAGGPFRTNCLPAPSA